MDIDAANRQISAWNACADARTLARSGSVSAQRITEAQDSLYRAQHYVEQGERKHAAYYARKAERALIEARSRTQSPALRVAIGAARDATTVYIRVINS